MPFADNVVRRRRRCKKCRRCWWTIELPEDVALKLSEKCEEYELNVKPATFTIGASHDEDGEA